MADVAVAVEEAPKVVVRAVAALLNRRTHSAPRPDLLYCYRSGLCPKDLPKMPTAEHGVAAMTERKKREERERARREEEAQLRAVEAERRRLEEIDLRQRAEEREQKKMLRETARLQEERALVALRVREQHYQQRTVAMNLKRQEKEKIEEKKKEIEEEKRVRREALMSKYREHIEFVEKERKSQQQEVFEGSGEK